MAQTAVLVIAEAGKDVKTCSDFEKVFDSRLKTLKTKTAQTIAPNGTHYSFNFGYVPIHLYAGYLSTKSTYIGFIGQNTVDNDTNVQVGINSVSNDSNSTWASSALIYIFIEQLV